MFGRRSHTRFSITPASEGVLRVLKDVVLQPSASDELIAISREAGIVGEAVTVELVDRDKSMNRPMRIVESRAIVLDGAVRHRLRLELVDPGHVG